MLAEGLEVTLEFSKIPILLNAQFFGCTGDVHESFRLTARAATGNPVQIDLLAGYIGFQ
jgi:hypothetical protein